MNKYIPIGFFILLVALLGFGLTNDPKEVPSPFIGKVAPAFETSRLYSEQRISAQAMQGQVWLLNVFASWCVSCRAEHKLVSYFSKNSTTAIVGLNYKDETKDAKAWLRQFGNPYDAIAVDLDGEIGIEWGVYGVPETFVIDKKGIVRYKQIGPITKKALLEKIMPLVSELEKE